MSANMILVGLFVSIILYIGIGTLTPIGETKLWLKFVSVVEFVVPVAAISMIVHVLIILAIPFEVGQLVGHDLLAVVVFTTTVAIVSMVVIIFRLRRAIFALKVQMEEDNEFYWVQRELAS